MTRTLLAGLCALTLLAAPCRAEDAPLPAWQAPLAQDAALVGRIFDPAARRFVGPEAVLQDLASADFVLLGEKHDNPDHHALQGWVIEALARRGRRPAVAFEMLTADQAEPLAEWLRQSPGDAAGLGPAVGWERTGWPSWSIYAPIAGTALRSGLPIVAADLSRAVQRAIGRGGIAAALDPDAIARLGLGAGYDPAQAASLRDTIVDSHCGHARPDMVERMMDVQRARDAQMAAAMIAASSAAGDGAVLIAGAGHVTADRGVPWHLRRMAPARTVRSVAFSEVPREGQAPERDRLAAHSGLAVDYHWYTPRVDDDDPCEKYAERLRRMREGR